MIFAACFRTTDGKKWSVGFAALSWEDAESIAEQMGLFELGLCFGTTPAIHNGGPDMDNLDQYKWDKPVSHFCAWHLRDGKFVNEEIND